MPNVIPCVPKQSLPVDFFAGVKAKLPILSHLAYFISRVHPHYRGRLQSLRIPSLSCICNMFFCVTAQEEALKMLCCLPVLP